MGWEVFAKQTVFMNCKVDDKQVEDAEQDEDEVVGEAVAVQLVGNEQSEHGEARGIGPKLFAEESDDQDRFDDTVTEQIESVEMMFRDREVSGKIQEMVGDAVVAIRNQLVVAPPVDLSDDHLGTDEIECKSTSELHDPLQTLHKNPTNQHPLHTLSFHLRP